MNATGVLVGSLSKQSMSVDADGLALRSNYLWGREIRLR